MRKIITTINEIYIKFEDRYGEDNLENIIFDSIIVLACNDIKLYRIKSLNLTKEKINRILNEPVYRFLKNNLPKELLKMDNLLPTIYEYIIRRRDMKEKYGIYYTPKWLVKYIVGNSIENAIRNINSINEMKILEPACGAGMFLIYIFDILFDWSIRNTELSREEIVRAIIEDNLYGIDIDPKSLLLCKYTLFLKIINITGKYLDINFNLYNHDFLKESRIDAVKFDFIIGNPPYLENRRINKYFNKEYLKSKYITAVGRFDIYSLFVEKSIDLLKNEGILAFVLPGNLLTNNNFTAIRKLILEKTCIKQIVDLGEGIFNNVNMNMAIIILKNKLDNKHSNLIKCKNVRNCINIEYEIVDFKYRLIPQSYYFNLLKYVFDIDSSEITFKLRNKIFLENQFKINDICEIVAGIATGNIRTKLITKKASNEKAKKVLEGKNITDYYHEWKGLFIIDDRSIIDKSKGEYATFMREEFINEEKILIRQTADRFICSYDNEKYYLLNTLYSLRVREEYKNVVNIKYILGVLNSKFYSFLYKSLVRESGKLFPQVKIFHIQNSPIIIPSFRVQKIIVDKVDRVISAKKELKHSKNMNLKENNCLINEIDDLKREIDWLIYKIFNLTNQEILEVEDIKGYNLV